jgi:hypothetical protein
MRVMQAGNDPAATIQIKQETLGCGTQSSAHFFPNPQTIRPSGAAQIPFR